MLKKAFAIRIDFFNAILYNKYITKKRVYIMLKENERLESLNINATVRRTLGADINASCGQLRKEHKENWVHLLGGA